MNLNRKHAVLKEYFLNAYLIALLKELSSRAAVMAADSRAKAPALARH